MIMRLYKVFRRFLCSVGLHFREKIKIKVFINELTIIPMCNRYTQKKCKHCADHILVDHEKLSDNEIKKLKEKYDRF